LILSHRIDLERKRRAAGSTRVEKGKWFQPRSSASEPKNRADGTPEYSM
jgi:hypothetical protein